MLPWFVSLVFLPSHVHACLSFPLTPWSVGSCEFRQAINSFLSGSHALCRHTKKSVCRVFTAAEFRLDWSFEMPVFPLKLRARFLFTSALETTQNTLQMLIIVANLHSPHSYLIASAKTSEPRRHQPIFSPNILKSLLDRCLYLQLRATTSLILT